MSIQFIAFDIGSIEFFCNPDHLTITDGDGTTLMQKSCGSFDDSTIEIGGQSIGSSLPPNITSRSNVVNFEFITNQFSSNSGWSANWSAVTPGECQQHQIPINSLLSSCCHRLSQSFIGNNPITDGGVAPLTMLLTIVIVYYKIHASNDL